MRKKIDFILILLIMLLIAVNMATGAYLNAILFILITIILVAEYVLNYTDKGQKIKNKEKITRCIKLLNTLAFIMLAVYAAIICIRSGDYIGAITLLFLLMLLCSGETSKGVDLLFIIYGICVTLANLYIGEYINVVLMLLLTIFLCAQYVNKGKD